MQAQNWTKNQIIQIPASRILKKVRTTIIAMMTTMDVFSVLQAAVAS
jgi:hypothetical protein